VEILTLRWEAPDRGNSSNNWADDSTPPVARKPSLTPGKKKDLLLKRSYKQYLETWSQSILPVGGLALQNTFQNIGPCKNETPTWAGFTDKNLPPFLSSTGYYVESMSWTGSESVAWGLLQD
jgi:hypothetical protein